MRPDKPKLQAQQKSGSKDQKKDLEERNQPKAASTPANDSSDDNALAKVRHREQKGPTLH
ncbi:hypothetical protein [Lysobacter auxotrophicus]|uniref:Uncharacterized protein n=1 Tax=Lysobacter auxotrophicus TaxID=2992573 RepID=A0ABM8DI14_9GAMM|nr:hypothetical protein [Lysobacter auxotrophicus]BDU18257.1 hypothetical protein LA521A_34580 [Lysobacter auxotrophicus]